MSQEKMLVTLGKFDIPIIQMQPPFIVDLLDANVALFGAAMSGKTTFIKTLVNILHKQYDEKEEQIFILDFGGALSEYGSYPLVSAYFDNSNEEYVKRVFKIMENILKDNLKALGGKIYRDSKGHQPIHTTFILDNLNAFIDEPRYMAYQEKLAKLCRDGLSKGISIVITAVETKGLASMLGNFKQKIAFEMPPDKYPEIFNGKVGQIGNNPGHGFANVVVKPDGVTGTFRMNLPYEVQCTLPYASDATDANTEAEDSFASKLKSKFAFENARYLKVAKKYQTFPKELTRSEYEKLLAQSAAATDLEGAISVGLDYVDFKPVSVNLDESHAIAIYGKKEFGKTNLLNLLLSDLLKQKPDARIVLFDDGRKQLSNEHLHLPASSDIVRFEETKVVELRFSNDTTKTKKLSPLQQFYIYLNENYITMDKPQHLAEIYGVSKVDSKQYLTIPSCKEEQNPFTVFVIQSKQVFLMQAENKRFIANYLAPLASSADEQGLAFIFSDVQKISDAEQNQFFNNVVSTAFLLDNIAEFAGERGQKTIFGNMDVKTLKEDYARCEKGDGYFYDVEADSLQKLKFIKYE
jgi:energy-coupling factor transporter ATP-binding protein EcfA2